MYNCDKMIPLPTREDHSGEVPVQPIGDFISLRFSERRLIDVTIEKSNHRPKVVSISEGSMVRISYVNGSRIDTLTGVIKTLNTIKERRAPFQTNKVPCECHSELQFGSCFVIVLDCSTDYKSTLYDISSDKIRDLDLITEKKKPKKHHDEDHKCCACGKCHKEDNKPSDENTGDKDISGDMDITPNEDIEGDDDFGTDPDNNGDDNSAEPDPDDSSEDDSEDEDTGTAEDGDDTYTNEVDEDYYM